MTHKLNDKVQTPDGPGLFISLMHGQKSALVAIKRKAAEMSDEELERYSVPYREMTKAQRAAFKKKTVYDSNREYPLEEISYL